MVIINEYGSATVPLYVLSIEFKHMHDTAADQIKSKYPESTVLDDFSRP